MSNGFDYQFSERQLMAILIKDKAKKEARQNEGGREGAKEYIHRAPVSRN